MSGLPVLYGMQKTFHAVSEDAPGAALHDAFHMHWPRVREWYTTAGDGRRPSAAEARTALAGHMPELAPVYDTICARFDADDLARAFLSGWNPPPFITSCSQAVWLGDDGPALARNYDFALSSTQGLIVLSRWLGRRVIAMAEGFWGALDGMNDSGFAASLTFGGRFDWGPGFSILLVVRYLLETCRATSEATEILTRIPIATSQNLTLVDRSGSYATVFVGPGRAPVVTDGRVCTNHQDAPVSPQQEEASGSVKRHDALSRRLAQAATLAELTCALQEPPLYARLKSDGCATVYEAAYLPGRRYVDYMWPGHTWRQSFDRFQPGSYTHTYV